jgi:hypothetical protein
VKIFYIGDTGAHATSRHRADALERIGHQVTLLDPRRALSSSIGGALRRRLHYHTGYRLLQAEVRSLIQAHATEIAAHDVVWVGGGEFLGPAAVSDLRALGPRLVLFNNDDPTGPRDGARYDSLVAALPLYDLCVTVRDPTLEDFRRLGVRHSMKTWGGCDEIVHAPPTAEELAASPYPTGIIFAGTWIRGENRDAFLADLVERGVPLTILGDRWSRSRYWPVLKASWAPAVHGRQYTMAIASAVACIGLMSKGNRDLHTRRSLEIPYAGGVLIAERTPDHVQMFADGVEALLWDDADECAAWCGRVLNDPDYRARVRAAGMTRIRTLGVDNQKVVEGVLDELFSADR